MASWVIPQTFLSIRRGMVERIRTAYRDRGTIRFSPFFVSERVIVRCLMFTISQVAKFPFWDPSDFTEGNHPISRMGSTP